MVELKGSLGGIGLPAIVQLLSELRETGRLRLSNDRWASELTFENGVLIAASFGRERGLSALAAAVLTLTEGEFVFLEGGGPAEHNIELTAEELRVHMAELGARRGGIDAPIPSLEAVPQVATTGEESATPGEHVVLERSAVQMLLLVDGARTVREIVGSRSLLPAIRDLQLLIEQGLITVPDPPVARPAAPRVRLVIPQSQSTSEAAAPLLIAPQAAPPESTREPIPFEGAILGACPRLGFADDPTRHYSRPTALHRCFATNMPSLVSSQDQRELCLGGRYATCARFRAAGSAPPPPPPSIEIEPVVPARPAMPAGVAARLAAAEQMAAAAVASPSPDISAPAADADEDDEGWRGRLGRAPLLIAGGVVAGLLLVALTIALLPLLQQPAIQTGPTPQPAFAPVLSPPPAAVRTNVPVSASTATPSRSTATQTSATPAALPKPTPIPVAGASPGQALLDMRFSVGAQEGWLENSPFALWRDGAYRLAARQSGRFVAVSAPVQSLEKVLVSATLRKTGGPPGGGYGVVVRDQGPDPRDGSNQVMRAYVFEAGDQGEFGVWRRDGDRWVDLVPWTRSSAVRSGGSPNELTVRTDGNFMSFSINGVDVATVEDDSLPSDGKVGVFVGGDFNEVALDRIFVQVPD